MINGPYAREFNFSELIKSLTERLKMKTRGTPIWSVIVVTIMALLLFWAGALVYAYEADDRSPAPADERSVPASRSY
jgi:hypothetical protein